MPIVIGWNSLFGRTDKVPGLFFVGTSFFYFCFIPLIPLGSYVVRFEDDDWLGGFKGIPIGISVKSVLFAWMRAAAVIAILFTTWVFIQAMIPIIWSRHVVWQDFATLAAALVVLWVLRVASVASPERTLELAQMAGYTIERVPAPAT